MSQLEKAMKQAEVRKQLVGGGREGVILADSEFQDRAIFSGFDLEYDELVGTSAAVADVFCQASRVIGLRSLFISSWCDGLLTGLLLASLPSAPPSDDTSEIQ